MSGDHEEFFASFKPVAVKGAHRWVLDDAASPSAPARGCAARCETCGLYVAAELGIVGLTLEPELVVAGRYIGGGLHMTRAREPYDHTKPHHRCTP